MGSADLEEGVSQSKNKSSQGMNAAAMGSASAEYFSSRGSFSQSQSVNPTVDPAFEVGGSGLWGGWQGRFKVRGVGGTGMGGPGLQVCGG